jgi:hypothetical protein
MMTTGEVVLILALDGQSDSLVLTMSSSDTALWLLVIAAKLNIRVQNVEFEIKLVSELRETEQLHSLIIYYITCRRVDIRDRVV